MPTDPTPQPDTQAHWVSRKALWAGWILSALPALFLLFDGGMKLFKPEFVVKATVQLGYPESVIVPLGIVLTVCTVLYLIPRTAVLGAILLTGILAARSPLTCESAQACSKSYFPSSLVGCSGADFSCAMRNCARSFLFGVTCIAQPDPKSVLSC